MSRQIGWSSSILSSSIQPYRDNRREQYRKEVYSTENTLVRVLQETVVQRKKKKKSYCQILPVQKFMCNWVDLQHYFTGQMQFCGSTANSFLNLCEQMFFRCLTQQAGRREYNGQICFSSVSTPAKLRVRKISPVSLHSKRKTHSFQLQQLSYCAGVPCRKVQRLGGGKQRGAGQ